MTLVLVARKQLINVRVIVVQLLKQKPNWKIIFQIRMERNTCHLFWRKKKKLKLSNVGLRQNSPFRRSRHQPFRSSLERAVCQCLKVDKYVSFSKIWKFRFVFRKFWIFLDLFCNLFSFVCARESVPSVKRTAPFNWKSEPILTTISSKQKNDPAWCKLFY